MSTDDNRQTALRFLGQVSEGHLDDALVTDDVAWWVPGRGTISKSDFLAMSDGFRAQIKGPLAMTVRGVTAEGDRVALEAESHAEMANGKIYNNTYHFLFLFRDGKIYLCKEYNDSQHAADILGSLAAAS